MSYRIGILGTSDIADRTVITPSRMVDGLSVYAVGSRDINKAKIFAERHNLQKFMGSYEGLLDDDAVDIVYIATPPATHACWIIQSLKRDKHVLVEKPICLTVEEIERIQEALSKTQGVLLLEGMMTQHHAWIRDLREVIEKKSFGEIISLKTDACYLLENNDNSFRRKKDLGGGVFFEEGNTWLQLNQVCFNEAPIKIKSERFGLASDEAELSFNAFFTYKNGATSFINCSYEKPYLAQHLIQFEAAHLKVKNFWRPSFGFNKLHVEIFEKNELTKKVYVEENYYLNQLTYMCECLSATRMNHDLEDSWQRVVVAEHTYQTSVFYNQ